MSKNRNVRNAKAIRTKLKPVVFLKENLKFGVVYEHHMSCGNWLFTLDAAGDLMTDFGWGISHLGACTSSHNHWYRPHRVVTPRLNHKP